MISAVFDGLRFPHTPGLNQPPYSLGTFDTIVTYKGGKYGRDKYFTLGFSFGRKGSDDFHELTATYASDHGNVVLTAFRAETSRANLELTVSKAQIQGKIVVWDEGRHEHEEFEIAAEFQREAPESTPDLTYHIMEAFMERAFSRERKTTFQMGTRSIFELLRPPYASCFSFGPIRSKPRRTYDEFSEEYSPEGDHIPTLLSRLLSEPASDETKVVQSALSEFGAESGLFETIRVKKLGNKAGDPFQIRVAIKGPAFNLTDVGYGVSQALPLVVQSVLKTRSKVLLMQQPEVHLHPKAQAALGSFFATLVEHDDRIFVLETHSDYLVDRVRQEVAKKNIAPDKVMILFFNKPQQSTKVHPITLDSEGNVQNAPPAYRRFFLDEELNLLNRLEA
jgi:hypothetical protein